MGFHNLSSQYDYALNIDVMDQIHYIHILYFICIDNSPWAKSRYLTCQYHQSGPHFNGTNLFRYIYSKYFFLLDIPNA